MTNKRTSEDQDLRDITRNKLLSAGISQEKLQGESWDLSHLTIEGNSLNLANTDFMGDALSGITIKAQLIEANFYEADLAKANLNDLDMFSAKFTKANMKEASLMRSRMNEADLSHADLSNANLTNVNADSANCSFTNFTGATLHNVNFTDANLEGSSFYDADLSNADLASSRKLESCQLAGTILTGTKLPEEIGKWHGLKTIEESSKNSRNIFILILTLISATFFALLSKNDVIRVPIINIEIASSDFLFWTPWFLLMIYVYFHLYLQRLWDEIALMPAVFEDGKPLSERIHPWLLSGIVQHFIKADNSPALSILQSVFAFILAWLSMPILMTVFLGKAMNLNLPTQEITVIKIVAGLCWGFFFVFIASFIFTIIIRFRHALVNVLIFGLGTILALYSMEKLVSLIGMVKDYIYRSL